MAFKIVNFRIVSVGKGPKSLAQKIALRHLLMDCTPNGRPPAEAFTGPTEAWTQDAFIRTYLPILICRWRQVVFELRNAGWATPTGLCLEQMLNCPPPFVYTEDSSSHCNRSTICPWCWCRRIVLDAFEAVDYALHARSIYQRRTIWYLHSATHSVPGPNVEHCLAQLPNVRRILSLRQNPWLAGAYYNSYVSGHSILGFQLRLGAIGLRSAGSVPSHSSPWFNMPLTRPPVAIPLQRGLMPEPYGEASRNALAAAVGAAFTYPFSWVLTDPTGLSNYLTVRGGEEKAATRMRNCSGILRNKSQRLARGHEIYTEPMAPLVEPVAQEEDQTEATAHARTNSEARGTSRVVTS